MIPTDTPCSAAASAARWPARPAPITKTSWSGTGRSYKSRPCGRLGGAGGTRNLRPQCSPDRVDRQHASDVALGVRGDQGAEAPQRLVAEHGFERIVLADGELPAVAGQHVADAG